MLRLCRLHSCHQSKRSRAVLFTSVSPSPGPLPLGVLTLVALAPRPADSAREALGAIVHNRRSGTDWEAANSTVFFSLKCEWHGTARRPPAPMGKETFRKWNRLNHIQWMKEQRLSMRFSFQPDPHSSSKSVSCSRRACGRGQVGPQRYHNHRQELAITAACSLIYGNGMIGKPN